MTTSTTSWVDGHTLRNRLSADRLIVTGRVVLVPVADAGDPSWRAVEQGLVLGADHTLAVHVRARETFGAVRRLLHAWDERDTGVPLIVLDSPDGDVAQPILDYVRRRHHRHHVIVQLPQQARDDTSGGWARALDDDHVRELVRILSDEPNVQVRTDV